MASPLYVNSGTPLTPLTVTGSQFSFSNVDFSKCAVRSLPASASFKNGQVVLSPSVTDMNDVFPHDQKEFIAFLSASEVLSLSSSQWSGHRGRVELGGKTYSGVVFSSTQSGDEDYIVWEDSYKNASGFLTSKRTILPSLWQLSHRVKRKSVDQSSSESGKQYPLYEIVKAGENSVIVGEDDYSIRKDHQKDYNKLWNDAVNGRGVLWIGRRATELHGEEIQRKNSLVEKGGKPDVEASNRRWITLTNFDGNWGKHVPDAQTTYFHATSGTYQKEIDEDVKEKYLRQFTTFGGRLPAVGPFGLWVKINTVRDEENSYVRFCLYESKNSRRSGRDYLEIKFHKKKDTEVTINYGSSVSGPLTPTENSYSLVFTKGHEGVYFIYPTFNNLCVTSDLVTSADQTSKALNCMKDGDIRTEDACVPPLAEFPERFKRGNASAIRFNDERAYMKFGNTAYMEWLNADGEFAIMPMRFFPALGFVYVFRMDGYNPLDEGKGISNLFCLKVGGNTAGWSGWNTPAKAKFAWYDKETKETVYTVTFRLYHSSTSASSHMAPVLQTEPIEILGIIRAYRRIGVLSDTRNADGNFFTAFQSTHYPSRLKAHSDGHAGKNGWMSFIKRISVNTTLDGISGSITLDKYMMNQALFSLSPQVIGALTLVAHNREDTTVHNHSVYDALPDGQFFKGYAFEIGDSLSEGASEMTVNLVGINRKLNDMVIVNSPYWDGDNVFGGGYNSVLPYMRSCTGCRLIYDQRLSRGTILGGVPSRGYIDDFYLPVSTLIEKPSTHYELGTPFLNILKDLAEKVNHKFVIQPDGKGYFYGLDKNALPTWVTNGPIVRTYKESDIISLSLQPVLDYRYNAYMTVALQGRINAKDKTIEPTDVMPGTRFTELSHNSTNFPWARIITVRAPGVLDSKGLDKFHRLNVMHGTLLVFQGSMTVRGHHSFFLYDKVRVEGAETSITFYIMGIRQDLDLTMKSWTTTLNIALIS